jgi:UPF0716 protein FxsA
MPLLFLIALFGAPYLEFLVFAEVANEIGGFSAIMLTLVTAIIGIYIIRQEGLQVLHNLKNTVQRGESPVTEIIHGFFLVVAGFFFLLPGFITDSVAAMLAIAPIRGMLGNMLVRVGEKKRSSSSKSKYPEGIIIDGEFEEMGETPPFNKFLDTESEETDLKN